MYPAVCPAGCFNGGSCTLPEVCTCAAQWTGNNCTQGMKFAVNYKNCYCIAACMLHMRTYVCTYASM